MKNEVGLMDLSILNERRVYLQPEYLCGVACVVALRDVLFERRHFDATSFGDEVNVLALQTEEGKMMNPIGLESLTEIAKSIGVRSSILYNDHNRLNRQSIFMLKVCWNPKPRFIDNNNTRNKLIRIQDYHYPLCFMNDDRKTRVWDTSFSGANYSPWTEDVELGELLDCNRASGEKGVLLFEECREER